MRVLKDYGAIITFALQLLWFLLAWWFRRSVATREDILMLTRRLEKLEQARETAPSLEDIAELRLQMERHTGEMRAFSATLTGARETWNARVQGLEQTVKRAETLLDTLTRHLLNAES